MSRPIGEVIESSTRQFVAEVYDDVRGDESGYESSDGASDGSSAEAVSEASGGEPAFGEWVRVETSRGDEVFALVSHVEIGSYDTNRQAVALRMSEEERRREMPMVQELLRMTVHAQILACRPARDRGGRRTSDRVRQTLPPHPPDIHDFVYPCTKDEVKRLAEPYDFLRTLVQSPDPAVPVDDLLVATLQQVYRAHGGEHDGRDALVSAGRALSRLLDDDHERLQSILRRVL